MFKDRRDAGIKLAHALAKYKGGNVLVLAIPRGGVEVAYQVAQFLGADLSLLVSRKLPYPDNPEVGFGAVAEDGSTLIFGEAARWLSRETVERIIKTQIEEIGRRIEVLRNGRPLPAMAGRTVILVDDGLAMGSTMRVAVALCRKAKAEKIIVAVPVAGKEVAEGLTKIVDELVVLETPPYFYAVAQVYENWYDVPDEEVLAIMERVK
ncbi:MAG: phosphoribosyltransferase [candidate division Zixibacteria bacterium]|nr:phosphoribosyltransferase [candidate division Zixibacteria bacterium]